MAFDLLQDFWSSLAELKVRGVSVSSLDRNAIDRNIRTPLTAALEKVEGPVHEYGLTSLRHKTSNAIQSGEFCVTLDHGVYFHKANFQLDLSRTASDLRHTGSRRLIRRPRSVQGLPDQLKTLAGALTGSKRQIVLADDGLATGQTLRMVISQCRDYDTKVQRVVVCCNNTELKDIDSVQVSSLIEHSPGRPWLNERDLYWGLPRSGLTFAPKPKSGCTYSIPFSAYPRLVQQRIGVEDEIDEFRNDCLHVNRDLWLMFEKQAGRKLFCEDCPPLRFIPDLFKLKNKRVVDLLSDLIDRVETFDFESMSKQ